MLGDQSRTSFDVIIIGAGISGLNAAYRIQSELSNYSYTILESRDRIGGTWDLFRYPGIRSDSDLFTFGFPWHPWKKSNPIATGDSILTYLDEAASEYGIDKRIRYRNKVSKASWSSKDQQWTLESFVGEELVVFKAQFLVMGTGYYDYSQPLSTEIPGIENFEGSVIHPQFWPEKADCVGKRITVIGSGATAITLVPRLAEEATKVTMLQRSPTYIIPMPNRTAKRTWLGGLIPDKLYHKLKRLGWIISTHLFVSWCRRFPNAAKDLMRKGAQSMLPATFQYNPHLTPRYLPWEQRLCVCPDGDFFKSIKSGKVDIETATIDRVNHNSICLTSGKAIETDIIVTATGLKLQVGGGIKFEVDGKPVDISQKFMWNSIMVQDMPNIFFVIGYVDASWTLGADVTAHFICRLLKHLEAIGCTSAIPRLPNSKNLEETRILQLTSTYVRLGKSTFPKAATSAPWAPRKEYFRDLYSAKYGSLASGLEFQKASRSAV